MHYYMGFSVKTPFFWNAEDGGVARHPCIPKKGGNQSLLGQVFRDWFPPTVNVTYREPIS